MGHGRLDVVTSHENMMTNIQRNPTIPMTKRDSLLSNGSRVSLLANCSSATATPKKFEDKDYINTNPNMVAGKKRSPKPTKKVKRTDSYKIATNRQSVDDLDGHLALNFSSEVQAGGYAQVPRREDRTKYNTLPRTDTVIVQKKNEPKRKKHASGDSLGEFERHASQKSGTYPSPDTDEDQRATEPDRKKKSAFKRMKERLILTFKKDNERYKKKNRKVDKYKSPSSRVKPNTKATREAFGTPNEDIDTMYRDGSIRKEPNVPTKDASQLPLSNGQSAFERNHKFGVTNGGLSGKNDDQSSQSNKGHGFFRTIRNSFRRKQAPPKYKKGSEESQFTGSSSQPHSESSLERGNAMTNGSLRHTSKPIDIHTLHGPTTVHVGKIEEEFIHADDSITELFGSLIDPEGSVEEETVTGHVRRPRPDTSHLKLEGLKKFKPRSFDKSSPLDALHRTTQGFVSNLSPTVEIDGFDFADAPTRGAEGDFPEESDLEFAAISEKEQQRRVDNVAKRLAAIGDSIVSRRESESAGSSEEIDGIRVGSHGRRLSQLEQEVLEELRRYGDDIDGVLFARGNRFQFSTTILPIIKGILSAQDYSHFRSVVQREISNTVGWEQVAWYTYLMRATMDLARASKTVGGIVKHHATRYFSTTIRPWIQSRPNGWESIHEETDVDSELD